MNRPGSRNRKNKKKITGALAGAGIVALFLALMISFGKTAPENPMDRNRADASRMYLLSSTLDMDMDQLANIGNANINAGDSANQAEQEEQQQGRRATGTKSRYSSAGAATEPGYTESGSEYKRSEYPERSGCRYSSSLMNLIQKTRAAAVETEVPISRAMIRQWFRRWN